MTRTTIRMILVALVAASALTSVAEAAPKKPVHHRVKHSSRVSTGGAPAAAQTAPTRAKSLKAKRTSTSRRASAAKKSTVPKPSARRRPTTKPR